MDKLIFKRIRRKGLTDIKSRVSKMGRWTSFEFLINNTGWSFGFKQFSKKREYRTFPFRQIKLATDVFVVEYLWSIFV